MEPKHIELINANLVRLVKETKPSAVFLTTLVSKGILGDADIDKLQSISSRHQKNHELYSILKTRINSFHNVVCALNSTNQTGLRDLLHYGNSSPDEQMLTTFVCPLDGCSASNSVNSDKSSIRFHVNSPSHHFTGRVEYLDQIHDIFSNTGTAAIICQSIVGLGGIGKTELARKAVDQFIRQDEKSVLHVIWFNAETEQELTSDFRTLAKDEKVLGVDIKDAPGGDKDIRTIVKEVYTYFKNKRCLLVFDNAENEEYFVKFLPSSQSYIFDSCSPMVLITSRDNEWSNNLNCSVVKLELFSEEEAIQFVKKVLKLDDGSTNPANEHEFVKKLICRLEYLPLATKQAAFYISEQMKIDPNYGAKTYLEEWEVNCKKLLNKKIVGEQKTTYTTWKTSMDKIANDESSGEVAVDVLRKLAFIKPDGIKLEFFQNNQRLDLSDIREAFTLLLRYSMISHSASGCSIHRLVQEVTRIDMRLNGSEEYELDLALGMLTTKFDSVNLSQVQSAWNHTRRHRKLAIKYSDVPYCVCGGLRSYKGLKLAMEFAKQELEFMNEALANEYHMSILKLEAEYFACLRVLGRGRSGYDQLWKKVQKVLRDGSATEQELADLLWYFCALDSGKRKYPEAWSRFDGILRSVDASSCDKIWMCKFFDFGLCLYYAFDFSSSNIFLKKALKIIERTQSKDTNFELELEHWLKLASLYTFPADNTEAVISELLDSLCLLLSIMRGGPHTCLGLAIETSRLLFYKFGVIDEALSISRYYLFMQNEADCVSSEVPNILSQMSILLCEQGNFQEALECSLKAKSFLKDMQLVNFHELENDIYHARALGGVGREEESLNTILETLPQLLSPDFKNVTIFRLIFMNLVAAEVLLNNQENQWAQEPVNRADQLLSMLPMNVSMPFLSHRLCQIKQNLGIQQSRKSKYRA